MAGTLFGPSLSLRVIRQLEPYARYALEVYQSSRLHQLVQQRISQTAPWMYGPWDTVAVNLSNAFALQLSDRVNDNKAGRQEATHKAMHDKRSSELREHLLDVPKRHPRAHILADVRKLDVDLMGGLIVHLLLAIDGPTDSELEELIRVIRELWDRLYPNRGAVVNCNDFDEFMYRGSGSLIRSHESLAGHLEKAVIYLAETDRLIHYGFGTGDDGLFIGRVSGRPLR